MEFKRLRQSFSDKLAKVNIERICPNSYSATYLLHLVSNREYYLSIYETVIRKALSKSADEPSALSFVDYGCGNGLLGLFAKHCGFSKVILVDNNPDFIKAAHALSDEIGINPDMIICGDAGSLEKAGLFSIDIIAGTDVIEHIYSLEDFLGKISNLNTRLITVFTTSANPANFIKRKQLEKLQIKDELVGNSGVDGLSGERHEPFLTIRKSIIRNNFPAEENIELLAERTRGLRRDDIIEAVKKYQLTNSFPEPATGSNTAHPESGSWTERILTIKEYEALYKKAGFNLDLSEGYYNTSHKGLKGAVNIFLNLLVKFFGKDFAPYIILTGIKK